MKKSYFHEFGLAEFVGWICIYFSLVSLVYHIRWYIPWLQNGYQFLTPFGQNPNIWFLSQIFTNLFLLLGSIFLTYFIRSFREVKYLSYKSSFFISGIILCSIGLGCIGILKTILNNTESIHFEDWKNLESVFNLLLKSATELIFIKEPQTMYFMVGITLWIIKTFVSKALTYKEDSESVI